MRTIVAALVSGVLAVAGLTAAGTASASPAPTITYLPDEVGPPSAPIRKVALVTLDGSPVEGAWVQFWRFEKKYRHRKSHDEIRFELLCAAATGADGHARCFPDLAPERHEPLEVIADRNAARVRDHWIDCPMGATPEGDGDRCHTWETWERAALIADDVEVARDDRFIAPNGWPFLLS